MINNKNKDRLFNDLLTSVEKCNICSRMCNKRKILSHFNGSLNSKVLFIAEAPGRLGADCTGIPLFGDRTGDNFEQLLGVIGWNRTDVFVTNAILCNPQDEKGNNSTPTKDEIQNCSLYLEMTINLVNPDVIVTLGVKALDALKKIEMHNYTLKEYVARCVNWNNRKLFPLYHMGPRALIHRNLTKQQGDFISLSHVVDPKRGLKGSTSPQRFIGGKIPASAQKLSAALLYFLENLKSVSMFKLTKLLYLVDLSFLNEYGRTITGSTYLRMQEGPWIPSLKMVAKALEDEGRLSCVFKNRKPYYESAAYPKAAINLSQQECKSINAILKKYGTSTDAQIKTAAYLTKPMKYILKMEKKGESMLKTPVIYHNKTACDFDMFQK